MSRILAPLAVRSGGWSGLALMRGMRLLLVLGLVLSCAACGFRLRGGVEIPAEFSPLYIQNGGLVGSAIQDRLEGGSTKLTNRASDAGAIVRILSQTRSSRVVAVDRTGKALAYALEYRVRFDVRSRGGESVIPAQTLTLERTFDDNPDVVVLGKQLESDLIYQDMAADAADQVLLRLRASLARSG